ncbi:hypothetical protein P8452_63541 [Trifolium repens]|nr:hypothetical protein P8452_63541 [Trifolium repens]
MVGFVEVRRSMGGVVSFSDDDDASPWCCLWWRFWRRHFVPWADCCCFVYYVDWQHMTCNIGSCRRKTYWCESGVGWLRPSVDCRFSDYRRQEIVSYESPRPTSGIQRVIFVLFKQPCRHTILSPGWRQNFITRDFAEVYNLGLPVAALYFNCQRENGSGGRRMTM